MVLISSGKHLQSDTWTTLGVVISLVLVYFTKIYWIDAAVALVFGSYIIFVGYKIVRKSLSGIMDEADPDLLKAVVEVLHKMKKEWIDIHNMKINNTEVVYISTLTLRFHGMIRLENLTKKWKTSSKL